MSEILSSDGDKIEVGDLIKFDVYKDSWAKPHIGLLLRAYSGRHGNKRSIFTRFELWGAEGLKYLTYAQKSDPTYTLHKLS